MVLLKEMIIYQRFEYQAVGGRAGGDELVLLKTEWIFAQI